MMDEWVNQSELAKLLGVGRSRVSTKLKHYPGPRDAKGRIEKTAAMFYFENHSQQARRKRPLEDALWPVGNAGRACVGP